MEPVPGIVSRRTIPRCGTFQNRPEMFGVWRSGVVPSTQKRPTHSSGCKGQGGPGWNPGEGRAPPKGLRGPLWSWTVTPGWLAASQAPPATRGTRRGRWLGPPFSGRQRSAQPPAWYLDTGHTGTSRRPRCPGAGGSPLAPGGPALRSLWLGLLGAAPTLGLVQKGQQAGRWELAVLRGRSRWGGSRPCRPESFSPLE